MTTPYPNFDDTAHCRLPGVDPGRFHPPKGTDSVSYGITKKLCTGGGKVPACPFVDACREYGLAHAVHGIWGGIGDKERKRIRAARRIVPEPLSVGVIAGVPNSREQPAPDWYTRRPCVVCGSQVRTRNMTQHMRETHEQVSA